MAVIVKDFLKRYYQVDDDVKFDLAFAIRFLVRQGELDVDDTTILKMSMRGIEVSKIATAINSSVSTVNRKLNVASDKIAAYLGDTYDDNRIFVTVEKRLGRPLTDEEVSFCQFMMKFHGRDINRNLSIYNFTVDRGKFVPRIEDKTEG